MYYSKGVVKKSHQYNFITYFITIKYLSWFIFIINFLYNLIKLSNILITIFAI